MIRFQCDYGEGAHPSILKRLEDKEKSEKEAEKNEILKDLDLYGV